MKKIKGVFVFKVNNGPGGKKGVWVVDVKNGNGSVKHGSDGKKVPVFHVPHSFNELVASSLHPRPVTASGSNNNSL